MSITFGIKDMEFDSEHILEDFRDMYDNERLIVIFEVISNSIDVDATKVELKLRQNALGQYELSFLDNGPGMNEKRFEDFQVAGRSSKTKGFSLGFAGIGAKLPGIDSRISVETFDGKNTYACDFFIENKKMKVQNRKPTEYFAKPGTFYKLTFTDKNYYNFLEKSLEPEIIQTFNNAMLNGLDVIINKKKIKPWIPSFTEKQSGIVNHKGRKLPFTFYLLKEDQRKIDGKISNIEFHITGKTIVRKQLQIYHEIKPEFQNKIYVVVDSLGISDFLKTDKVSFKPGYRQYKKAVNIKIKEICEKLNLIGTASISTIVHNTLTRALADLFKNPEFSWLNPHSLAGIGIGVGPGTGGKGAKSSKSSSGKSSSGKSNSGSGGSGFSLKLIDAPEDPRTAYLDIKQNFVALNIAHPLYLKSENSPKALQVHMAYTVVEAIVNAQAEKKSLTIQEASELRIKILMEIKDKLWL